MNKCACPPSQHIYNASAYGFAAELERPMRHSIPSQAASVLGADGGRGSARVRDFKFDGIISVEDAHTEVGGSYDHCHNLHATYASSTLEGVNIADMLTADQVVSKLHIYTPDDNSEPSFTITGSHFKNLRIAGYKADVQLATSVFHGYDTYSKVTAAHKAKKADPWLLGSKLADLGPAALEELENTYHALKGMTDVVKAWKQPGQDRSAMGTYWCSPAHITLEGLPDGSEIKVVGNMVFIPKFGVIRVVELAIHRRCRTLIMFRVHMCSGTDGGTSGGGTTGGGGSPMGG
jgi:hypothetical protein